MTASDEGEGIITAKFQRLDLMNLEPGSEVIINCSGTISLDGQTITVVGNDTIRIVDKERGFESFSLRYSSS
jgi:hypothetical protein